MQTPESRLRQLRKFLRAQRFVEFAYLFGSAAKGGIGPLSDVDVAVYLNSKPEEWYTQKLKLREGLAWIFGVPQLDLVVLNGARSVLAHEIIEGGELIFERDETLRIKLEREVLREYLDTSYLRRVHRASIKEQITKGAYFD